MQISILGICIGKNSCSVVGVDDRGAVVFRRAMRRQTSMDFVEKLPRSVIAMEACCGAHHLGRLFAVSGHEVRLMSPEYVRPYVKEPKNDDRDAEGIAEAVSRPKMRFVELKSQEQLDIQTLYRFGQPGCGAMPRLTWIPGIDVLNATALVAAIGDASSVQHARDLGAWLGLVPRQFTTGGKARVLGITKRGNTHLRNLLVHGARAAMHTLSQSDTPIGQWLRTMLSRGLQRNVVIVALANKLARIAWAVLRKGHAYERSYGVAVTE